MWRKSSLKKKNVYGEHLKSAAAGRHCLIGHGRFPVEQDGGGLYEYFGQGESKDSHCN